MSDIPRKGDIQIQLVDPTTQIAARVDSSGRLNITSAGTPPANTTPVIETSQQDVSSTFDETYTITNGDTLTIQIFQAGSEQNTTGGSKVELYDDPNGNLSVLNLIAALYVNGNSAEQDIAQEFVGNGTRRIVMRSTALGGSAREIFGRWKGFETS